MDMDERVEKVCNIQLPTFGLLERQIRMNGMPRFPKKANPGSSEVGREEK
jgi:hypothetical protein